MIQYYHDFMTEEWSEDWEDPLEPYIPEDRYAKMDRLSQDKTTAFDKKYKPYNLSEIVGQPHLMETLQDFVKKRKINHLIFTGPKGVGKTCTATALGHEFFGPNFDINFQMYNVPNGNNDLKFINGDFREFINRAPTQATFRIALLDESEYLDTDAQVALKGIMEDDRYAHVRIILTTNTADKLLPQLEGENTIVLRFRPISTQRIEKYLELICEIEGLNCEGEALKLISRYSNGSLRQAVIKLDMLRNDNNCIPLQKIIDVLSYVQESDVKGLIERAINGEEYMENLEKLYLNKGVPIKEILHEIFRLIPDLKYKDKKLSPKVKRYIVDQLGLYDIRISQSSDHLLQMTCFLNSLADMPKT